MIPLIFIIGPFVILSILTYFTNYLDFLVRNSEDLQTGNARTLIWGFSLLEFSDFKPIHLFGYGEYGHYASGASQHWAYIFGSNLENSELTTPHSIFYSVLFDYGYLGLILLIIYLYSIMKRFKLIEHRNRRMALLGLLFIIYWQLQGITESFYGFYSYPNLFIIMIIFAFFEFTEFFYIYLEPRIKLSVKLKDKNKSMDN